MSTELTFLIDDKPGPDLLNEHGLSLLVKTEKSFFLFDTGQSSSFAENAKRLNINLADVEFCVVSHAHYDHGGGLPAFIDANKKAPVYLHKDCKRPVYYSTSKRGTARYIGIETGILKEHENRFSFIDTAIEPAPGIHIIPCSEIPDRGPIFNDNSLFLHDQNGESTETFEHEIFIVIERDDDLVILSGCSHNNILAIIRHTFNLFPGKKLAAVAGGFHLPDIQNISTEFDQAILKTAEELKHLTSDNRIQQTNHPLYFTGHCTGNRAKMMLKEELGSGIDFFFTGKSFLL